MNSEPVEAMTDAEVGQYILLLCKSFMSGKAASLPDDPEYLAKWARCKKVSPRVMAKFDLIETEWGPRRRNDTMYGEWLAASERSASASERGKKGNEVRWGQRDSNSPSVPNGDRYSDPLAIPQSFQLNQSSQTNQSNQNINSNSGGQGVFKNVRTHWYRHFKKNLSTSQRNHAQYAEACAAHGEDRVLEYLETWAATNQWVSSHSKGENRLYVFLADLPGMIAGDEMRARSLSGQVAAKETEESAIAAICAADDAAAKKYRAAREAEWASDEDLIAQSEGKI